MNAIPRRLHRVWCGPHPRPAEYDAWWFVWGQMHREWDRMTWIDSDVSDWETARLFDRCNSWAFVSDLVRIEAIWRFGGVYVDCDTEPIKPIDPLLDGGDRLTLLDGGLPQGQTVWNCAFMAPPRSPLLRELLDRFLALQGRIDLQQVGPPALAWLLGREGIRWLPYRYFSPQLSDRGKAAPDAYALHHFSATWNRR